MNNKSKNLPQNINQLNNILNDSDNYKQYSNKLFDNLIIPPGFCVNKNKKNNVLLNNICNKYINNDVYNNLLKLAEYKNSKNLTYKKKYKKNKIYTKKRLHTIK